MNSPTARDTGFALVTALWAALVLALLASAILTAARTSARVERTGVSQASQGAIAQAIINLFELRLIGPEAMKLPLDGRSLSASLDGFPAQVEIQDQAGLVDINAAPPDVLARVLTAMGGLDPLTAQGVTGSILDWRERGIRSRLNDAKVNAYPAEGYAYGPRQGLFESVAELQLVKGITPDVYTRLEPYLTVYSQTPHINPESAPAAVLSEILGWDAVAISHAIELREKTYTEHRSAILNEGSTVVSIKVRIQDHRHDSFLKGTVIRLTGNPADPFWTYLVLQ